MFCPQCGSQIPDGSAFCPNCGAKLASQPSPTPAPAPMPVPIPAPVAPEQPSNQQQAYQPSSYDPAAYQSTAQQAPSYPQTPAYQQQAPAPNPNKGLNIPQGDVLATPLKPFAIPSPIGQLFTGYNKGGVQYAEQNGIQMKWYKALTAALLYISAAYMLYSGIQSLVGLTYGDSSRYMYSIYPALRAIDIVYGLYLIVFVFAVLYVRMRLAQFSSDGPKLYLLMLLVNGGASLIYSLLVLMIVGNFAIATLAGSIGGVVAMFVLNRIYFNKRQHLFTM